MKTKRARQSVKIFPLWLTFLHSAPLTAESHPNFWEIWRLESRWKFVFSGAQKKRRSKPTSECQCSSCTSGLALVVYGWLETCQQLLQLWNECWNSARAANIQDGSFLVAQTESKCYFCTYHIWMCVIMDSIYLCVCLLIAKANGRTGV